MTDNKTPAPDAAAPDTPVSAGSAVDTPAERPTGMLRGNMRGDLPGEDAFPDEVPHRKKQTVNKPRGNHNLGNTVGHSTVHPENTSSSGSLSKHPPLNKPARTPTQQMQALEDDDNKRVFLSKSLRNILAVSRAFETPVQSDEEIISRLNWFFKTCAETSQLPTIEKLCLALGWTYEHYVGVLNSKILPFSEITVSLIQQAKGIIASLDAELATEGKIQPVVYIFRAKNYYGMKDRQEISVERDAIQTVSEETLREKYKDAIDVSEDEEPSK